jgi:hypothetical protein
MGQAREGRNARRARPQLQMLPAHVPEQHCVSVEQTWPCISQPALAHTSFSHWSSPQQSLVDVQLCPCPWQPGAAHTEPKHIWEQHWPLDWQASFAGMQAPSPHTPFTQLSEQHSAALPQSPPLAVQVAPTAQEPSAHTPEQHWPSPEHDTPSPAQPLEPQTPPLQT